MGQDGSTPITIGDRGIAFGGRAGRWAARLDFDVPVVFCDPTYAVAALASGLELRRSGRPFYLSVDLEDARRTAFRAAIRERVPRSASIDELRLLLEQPVGLCPLVAPEHIGPLQTLIGLAHGLVVRSWAEAERLRTVFGSLPRGVELVIAPATIELEDDYLPRTDIVVWGPYEPAETLAPFVTALQDFQLPLTIVAADGPTTIDRLRIVLPSQGPAALRRARLIVDATGNDPAIAVALATLGRPMCVAADGGAFELLSGAETYTYWNRRTILASVADALSAEAPRLRAGVPARPYLALPAPPTRIGTEKLVSVVIATRDRPAMLDMTLGTIDRQTYPAVEVIVVNDAGADVSSIVASHKRSRVLATQGRLGPGGARNVGLRSVRGEYVTFFDDDDEMFPDHIASLVTALERSNLDVAYGQMLNGFFLKAGTDHYVLDGVSPHQALLDHAEIQWAGAMATTSVLFRRKLIEEIGEVDGGLATAEDYDYWYRLAQGREWARVPFVTALYRWRLDGTNYSSLSCDRFVIAHRQIYLKHPTNRTLVAAGRQAFLDGLAEGAARDRVRMKNIARIG
jgi:hypothetical protein